MGLRVFDYLCPNGHREEKFVDSRNTSLDMCSTCGAVSVKQLATPRIDLDGCSGHFPTAADAWERKRESHMRKERKNVENHDSYK